MNNTAFVYVEDITEGEENKVISLINYQDEEKPRSWQYTATNIAGPGYDEQDFETAYEGCQCENMCNEATKCLCIQRFGPSFLRPGQLLESVIHDNKAVIECGPGCSCSSNCGHRLVQNGINTALQVFRTEGKGFGLKTLEPISQFSFVCEYAGEVISKTEAYRRVMRQTFCDNNYVYVLREHGSLFLETIVDPTHVGNVGRFLNHSCDPNLIPVPIRSTSVVPQVCLFALRDISAGEELTYSYSVDGAAQGSGGENVQLRMCKCGSKNCKGTLPFDHNLLQI